LILTFAWLVFIFSPHHIHSDDFLAELTLLASYHNKFS